MSSIKELIKGIDLRELVLRTYQFNEIGANCGKIYCPLHKDTKTPSMTIYADGFFCFGCGAKGDALDWIKLTENLTTQEALIKLKEYSGKHNENSHFKSKPYKYNVNYAKYIWEHSHYYLTEIAQYYLTSNTSNIDQSWFYSRGLASSMPEICAIIAKYRFGAIDNSLVQTDPSTFKRFDSYIILPYFNSRNEFVWFNARSIGDNVHRYKNAGGNKYLYNMQCINSVLSTGNLVLVEGELDTISILEATSDSFPVMGISGGGFTGKKIKPLILYLLERGIRIFTIMDPDDGGLRHELSLQNIFCSKNINVKHLYTMSGKLYNDDINAALQQYGRVKLKQMLIKSLTN